MEYEQLNVIGYRNGLWRGFSFVGLSGFRLRFSDNDHKIKFISVGGTTAEDTMPHHDYTLGLYDHSVIDDSEDVFEGWSKVLDLGTLTEEFVKGTFESRGTVSLRIPPIQSGESFILRGFSITQTRENDHNLRKIAVRLNASRNAIVVTFEDNSPRDDGFECKVVFGRVINTSQGYNMRTQFSEPFTIEKTFTKSTSIAKELSGKTLLTGFSFEFLDTDHFIREIKIDPEDNDKFEVVFTDNEEDNPVKVILDYVRVRFL
jgi:hypothetical protein